MNSVSLAHIQNRKSRRMSTPASCEALVVRVGNSNTPTLVKEQVPVPTPGEHQVLVKVSCVAQNPTDSEIHSFTLTVALGFSFSM